MRPYEYNRCVCATILDITDVSGLFLHELLAHLLHLSCSSGTPSITANMRLEQAQREVFHSHGFLINSNGGVYAPGTSLGYTKKVEVASVYEKARQDVGKRPNISVIARECAVSTWFVRKVESELNEFGRVLKKNEMPKRRAGPTGPCSQSLDDNDMLLLYQLYLDEPSRTRASYVEWLFNFTGKRVSETTISTFFNKCFINKGGLCKPNFVPCDKFRPENYEKMIEYVVTVSLIDPSRLKFGDEKHLKGQELFNRKVRRDILTGAVPASLTSPDFRNTYAITGFCGIDPRSSAVWFNIHEDTNGASEFARQLEMAIMSGFFQRGDILVLDNATIHNGGENSVLEEWLWTEFGIYLLFLPARSPELNPIERVWSILVQRMKKVPLNVMRAYGSDASAHAAGMILSGITHRDVVGCYKHCNYLE